MADHLADEVVETGFRYGPEDGARYGPEDGGSYGPQRARRYRVRLTNGETGREITIESTLSVDIALEHTGVSDVEVEVPRFEGLLEFALGDIDVFYGSRHLFAATIEKFPGPGLGDTATLYGRGPARSLTRGAVSYSFSSTAAHDAIREVWNDTAFRANVIIPNSTTTLSDFNSGGTPLEVLQDLHEQAGMRFAVLHGEPTPTVESFVPEENVKVGDWSTIAHDSSGDVTEYANAVEVYGGTKSGGGQAFARAEDTAEIDRIGEELVRFDDSSITTDADAQARADTLLAEKVKSDTLSGTLEITPEIVLPGYIYTIPEWERADGTTPELTVTKTSFSESPGEATATVDVNSPDGVEDFITDLRRETARLNQP